MQFTFECDELFMDINFTNTSFVFTKTKRANTFFDPLYNNIVSVEKKIQRPSCFKLSMFQGQIQIRHIYVTRKGQKKQTKNRKRRKQ